MNEIKILHGPYQVSEVWSHRPRRLITLREHLTCLGFHVELVPIQPRNRLIITLNGFEIFRCSLVNITSITVNDPKPNILLKNILWAAIEARGRFSSAKMALLGQDIPKQKQCCCAAKKCYCFLKCFRK